MKLSFSTGTPLRQPVDPTTLLAVQQVYPLTVDPTDVDPVECFHSDKRPAAPDRPWILVNMVSSIDGSIAVDGRAGGLSGPADQHLYQVLRGLADVILVGAGTIRAESYRAPRDPEKRVAELRKHRGQARRPRLAVVSGDLNLDPKIGMFAEHDPSDLPPLIYTTTEADPSRRAVIEEVAEVADMGATQWCPATMSADLLARGANVVLCEGGPTINAQLLAEGLIDEYCLTISPRVIGGSGGVGVPGQAPGAPAEFQLARVLTEEDFLFCRYLAI